MLKRKRGKDLKKSDEKKLIKRRYLAEKIKMAAKLCTNCGGRGEVPLFYGYTLDLSGSIPHEITWVICRDCDGLGYINL